MKTMPYFFAGLFLTALCDRFGVGNGILCHVGGGLVVGAFGLAVFGGILHLRIFRDSDGSDFLTPFGIVCAVLLDAGVVLLCVAAARCVTDRFGTKVSHCDRPCQCRENNPETAGRGPGGAGGEASGASGAFFDFEGFAPGVGGVGRRDESAPSSECGQIRAVGKAGFDEFPGGFHDGRGCVVRSVGAAGAMAEDGEFDVVHVADSSTGGDSVSPRGGDGR